MLSLGALAFATPLMLLGLLALPAIWWLLRISPPLPKRVRFPAIRLLVGLDRDEETPVHTPLWLLLLRLTLAAIIVMALANPLWNPAPTVAGSGPLLIVTDNGWASATHWRDRFNALDTLIAAARRDDRPILIVGTVPAATVPALDFAAADDASVRTLTPLPLSPDRLALLTRLQSSNVAKAAPQVIWLSDGIDYGSATDFAAGLSAIAGSSGLDVVEPNTNERGIALLPPAIEGEGFLTRLIRAADKHSIAGSIIALNAQGAVLGRAPFTFDANEGETSARLDLPLDLRNKVSRLEIAGETSAAAMSLLDERWRRRTVGIVSGSTEEETQQLLSDRYYLSRAIGPYAEIREASAERASKSEIADLLSSPLSVLILADIGNLTPTDRTLVAQWVEKGGVLVRFAGPKLAAQGEVLASDQLMPVPLRMGGRALGGELSWTTPQHLAPFEADSPFNGLTVPDDVTVSRQVLAEPTADLGNHTWARLADGTPLVTATTRDKGLVVLVHVTANSDWSNLPRSGLFVDILRRIIGLAQGVALATTANATPQTSLAPVRTLDGYGRLGTPPALATPVAAATFDATPASPRHPPGLYGPADSPRALNLMRADSTVTPVGALSGVASRYIYAETSETQLRPLFLLIALILIITDGIASLYVTGLFDTTPIRRPRRGFRFMPAVALALIAASLLHPSSAKADDKNTLDFALDAANNTRLAYVITGDATVDETSRAGLEGLSKVLRNRTSFDPAAPIGVNPDRDELAFFPLLYWPMTTGQESLTPAALARVNAYMEHGGTILFDTRDQDRNISGLVGPGTQTLRRLIGKLDLPALTPVSKRHVMTKSFYLMQDFPGRWTGGTLWVVGDNANGDASNDEQDVLSKDGVSPIIVGSNDYAAAWARNASGRPMFPCEPGGEGQREMAYRFGVNLVMYTLTGNYKADQVHIPALLERLGQ
ncbi:MAG: DUF4159 domain-containing protein [Parvibaculum sp.]|nr:DUF4159 domain-containing protein [Parvibaculum sp.]